MRKNFVFNCDWQEVLKDFPAEVRLEVYDAIIEYAASGRLSELKPLAKMAFSFMRKEIDANNAKYDETVKRRSEAGKKGMASRYGGGEAADGSQGQGGDEAEEAESPTNLTKPNKANKAQQAVTKPNKTNKPQQGLTNLTNLTDNVYDSVNDIDIEKEALTNVSAKKKAATDVATLLEGRKAAFYDSLVPFVPVYGKELIRCFFEYWSEPNRSKTKMRCELERTWDLSRRLKTWANREKQYNSTANGTDRPDNATARQRAEDAASTVARLLAEDDGAEVR